MNHSVFLYLLKEHKRIIFLKTMFKNRFLLINHLIINKTDNVIVQFFRYTFVGGIAFLIDFTALYFFTDIFRIHYLISAAMSFLLGVATNYSLSIFWVFPQRKFQKKTVEFGIFAFIGIIGLCFNEIIIWIFTEYMYFHYLVSKIFSTGFVLIWNFTARKFILFRGDAQ